MRTNAKPQKRPVKWRPGLNPWTWALGYVLIVCFAHCSEFDPNERGLSPIGELTTKLEAPFARREKHTEDTTPLQSASRTIDRLRRLPDPAPAGQPAPTGEVAPSGITAGTGAVELAPDSGSGWSFKRALFTAIDGAGLRQNWRLFQLPHPEVLGYEVKSYYREVKAGTELYVSSFSRCLELNDRGQCHPSIGSRLEFEMLREMERRRSPDIYDAFSLHWAGKSARPVSEVFRRYEFVVYRHAFKLSKDFSKRGHAQILYAKDF